MAEDEVIVEGEVPADDETVAVPPAHTEGHTSSADEAEVAEVGEVDEDEVVAAPAEEEVA